ncbi:MAG: UDP-N-acetylmuramoylalanine--D-glutamate ligase [Nocardioidaceae bacterium]|nr:UDP-N-acetylmuramoylalanine--D-glutamate ligase [Actinomycetota bacterium]MDX6371907.1 UDP-N-acetylmuramoylalanine--D-glutamate ligase [Nocardioidaceae bacterium]
MVTEYDGRRVVVAGAGISGAAAARVLRERGADVTVVDARGGDGVLVTDVVPAGTELVVTSPGWRPDAPLLLDAAAKGLEVIGEVELAWRLRPADAAPWLAVTGTNGKTTTVKMLASILSAAGHRTVAAGNVGLPLLDAVLDPSYDVLAVELSSFQLHWSSSLRPLAGAVLNIAPDHLDWHGSMAAYAEAKARIWAGETSIGNADDEITRTLLQRAPGRRVTFTLRTPRSGELGLVEDLLVDRAFEDVAGEATELAALSDLTVPGGHNVANALAAAALARAYGVPAEAVREGLRAFAADPHRNALVATLDGVAWVDDSKATNPHAAAASLAAYDRIVWIAGGLLKGADVDDLVRGAAPQLAAVVLLGTDRAALRDALARHAPDVPVVEVSRLDTGAMSEVVAAARRLAHPGDTVLLAPAAASMDCFRDYKERGDLFAAEVLA